MASVILYLLVLLVSTFSLWLSERLKSNWLRHSLIFIAFLLVFLPSAVRYDIGTDYMSYVAIFEDAEVLGGYKSSEPFFYYINKGIDDLGFGAQWSLAIFSFLISALSFMAYPRKGAWLWHFLFIALIWFFSFNGVRQAVAIAWCLLGLVAYFDRRYLWFLFLTIVASGFHQSALFISLFGMLSLLPLNNYLKTRIAPVIFVGLILFSYLSTSLVLAAIEQILNLVGFSKYAEYFQNTKHFVVRESGTGLGILAKVMFSTYIILNAKYIVRLNQHYWVIIVMTLGYAIGNVLVNEALIFGRMADTFVLGPILGGAVISQISRHRLRHQFVLSIFLLFLLLAFIKNGFSVESPKLNPYQTIFTS